MASQIVLPQGTYPIGTRTLGPATVPVGVSHVQLDLDGAAMLDPALHLTIQLDLSLDGGTTWASASPGPATNPLPVTLTTEGGMTTRVGEPLPSYPLACHLPDPSNANRRVKAVVTIAGTPLTTQGTLTLT